MRRGSSGDPGRVIHLDRTLGWSLLWLVVTVVLGGIPLGAYFTDAMAPDWNLYFGALVMGICFPVSLFLLGNYRVVVVYPTRRRIRYIKGLFRWQRSTEFDFEQVRKVRVIESTHRYRIILEHRDRSEWILKIPIEGAWAKARVISSELDLPLEFALPPLKPQPLQPSQPHRYDLGIPFWEIMELPLDLDLDL